MVEIIISPIVVQCGGWLFENVCNTLFYESGRDQIIERLKFRKLPVNQDIERAIRHSYYRAAQQAVKYCIRSKQYQNPVEKKSLQLLVDYFFGPKLEAKQSDAPNAIFGNEKYLDFSPVNEEGLKALKRKVQTEILLEFSQFLSAYIVHKREVPQCLSTCIKDGWQETPGGKQYTFFGWISDFFHEYVKTDPRVFDIIVTKWLATIMDDVSELRTQISRFLHRHSDDVFKLHGKVAELYQYLNAQPNLPYLFNLANDPASQKILFFRNRYADFVQRDLELMLLTQFFESEDNFSWATMFGVGGIGKSRLSMEFALSLRQSHNVNAGILSHGDFTYIEWHRWQPVCPTFIIIDDVSKISTPVLTALNSIYDRLRSGNRFDFPLRILLLERHEGEWWKSFEDDIGKTISKPGFEPFELGSLPGIGLQGIINDCIQKSGLAHKTSEYDWADILTSLKSIDPLGRPLFAMFAGIALSEGKDIKQWDRRDMLTYYFEREKTNLSNMTGLNTEDLDPYRNLAALATMTGGLKISDLDDLLGRYPYLPTLQDFNPSMIAYLCGDDPEGDKLMPMKPDFLGEYFVHAQLSPDPKRPFKDKNKRNEMISEAWNIAPREMFFFCVNYYQDLRHNTTMHALTNPANIKTDTAKFYFCNYALETCAYLITNELFSEIGPLYENLLEVCKYTESLEVLEKKNYVLFAIGIQIGNLGFYPQSEQDELIEEIKLVRRDSYAWYKTEDEEISNERFELADRVFKKSIEADDSYANHRYGLASLYHKRSKFDMRQLAYLDAEKEYRNAIARDEKHALAFHGLGNLYKDCLARPVEAAKCFCTAVTIDRRLPQAWFGLGNTLKVLGKYEKSEKAYKLAISLDDDFADPWDGLANLLRDFSDRPHEAEAAYRKSIALNERDALPRNGLGNLFMDHFQRYEEAEASYLQALEINPQFAFPVDNLIFLYRDKMNRLRKARNFFQENEHILSKNGANDCRYLHLAVFEAYEHRWHLADKHLRTAFSLINGVIPYATLFTWLRSLAIIINLGFGEQLIALLEEQEAKYPQSYSDIITAVRLLVKSLKEEVEITNESESITRKFTYMKTFVNTHPQHTNTDRAKEL
jgi:tetratricopeptide (TPR) repeat protein